MAEQPGGLQSMGSQSQTEHAHSLIPSTQLPRTASGLPFPGAFSAIVKMLLLPFPPVSLSRPHLISTHPALARGRPHTRGSSVPFSIPSYPVPLFKEKE